MKNAVLAAAIGVALLLPWPVAAQQQVAQSSIPTSQKVIKDPAEFNAYMAALRMTDATQKAAAFEAFATRYPNSVVKREALEHAMAAYQQTGNAAKVEQFAERILQIEPDNARALAVVVFIKRNAATQGNAAALAALGTEAQHGVKALAHWPKPEGVSDAQFRQLRSQMTAIFQGAAGFVALQAKDYAKALTHYRLAVAAGPNNLPDVYQLGIVELEMTPLDATGFWHIARALKLAGGNAAAQQAIARYGKAKYSRYHGGDDGWDALVAQVATQAKPPAGFAKSIKPAH